MNEEELRKKLAEDPNYEGESDEEKALIVKIKAEKPAEPANNPSPPAESEEKKVTKQAVQEMVTSAVLAAVAEANKPIAEAQAKIVSALSTPATPIGEKPQWEKDVNTLMYALYQRDTDLAKTVAKQVQGVGFLVPPQYVQQIYELLPEYGVARRNCTILPMNSNLAKIPEWLTDMEMEWVGGDHVKKVLSGEFTQRDLNVKKLAGIIPLNKQDIEDAVIDLVSFLRLKLAKAWAKAEDRAVFLGNTGAGINGLLQIGTAFYISSTSITGVTFDDIKHLTEAVTDPATEGAKFYMSRTIFNICQDIKDNQGRYIYRNPADPNAPATIWGFPYEIVNLLNGRADDGPGLPFIFFGNLEHYIIGARVGLSFETSEEATIEYVDSEGETINLKLWQKDMMAIKAYVREGLLGMFGSNAFSILYTAAGSS